MLREKYTETLAAVRTASVSLAEESDKLTQEQNSLTWVTDELEEAKRTREQLKVDRKEASHLLELELAKLAK